ncbi:RHO GTPase-activating protein RGD1 [Pseudocercospora fuligena]|uniref:RHO GTPase-activating protein RGD1 n=1 Tax=Pseudocercospora fuligena TaxID=685502 RepID=A0A8H6RAY2_9PEZI|nr:RHO GTPase-activating protein RGD1 [Pseudocercospora fuligena]
MSSEYLRDGEPNGDDHAASSLPGSPMVEGNARPNTSGGDSVYDKRVDDVMYSDIGINTLLNRLKQSIASARDFAQFLKKRSSLEEEQAKGLKRLAQSQLENVKRGETRQGTYGTQLTEVLRVHERMADNGMQFALSLHQMHEDLDVLSTNMERGRKQWKHEGLAAEKNASDAEQAMQKAKAKYDSLAEDYDRAKTGESKGSRRIGLKGPKSAEQHETDLLRRVQVADDDYEQKVNAAKRERLSLLKEARPKAVKALQDLIKECDSALTLQLQKFATFNEKLLLGNGLAISPLQDGSTTQRSLRDLVLDINNEKDFQSHIASFSHSVKPRPQDVSDIQYEKHPVLAPKSQPIRQPTLNQPPPAQPVSQPVSPQPPLAVNTASSQPSSMNNRYGSPSQASPYQPPSASYGGPPSHDRDLQTPSYATTQSPYNPQTAPLRDTYASPPYPTHPSERIGSFGTGAQHQQTTGSIPAPVPASDPRMNSTPPATGKGRVFGMSLDDLFARDQSAVPIIVFQCIQAVDLFGLEIEGIYRQTGNMAQVNRLRDAFDTLPPGAPQLDFRNPANFGHDVNAVTSLMKSFFRELPDPLFTRANYGSFIEAAQTDDDNVRRDGLHQAINDLPDANYATLRALVLHLARIMQNENKTRMTAANLAVCLAPTLMGAHQGPHIADASWQQRAVETILTNATAIFDED